MVCSLFCRLSIFRLKSSFLSHTCRPFRHFPHVTDVLLHLASTGGLPVFPRLSQCYTVINRVGFSTVQARFLFSRVAERSPFVTGLVCAKKGEVW